ncbi:MAG TPA: hypothetical protein VGG33_00815 [Polyangia bacterium]
MKRRLLGAWLAGLVIFAVAPANAQTPPPVAPGPTTTAPVSPSPPAPEDEDQEALGFVLPATAEVTPPLVLMGYVDVGFAAAEGDGTSYPAGDTRLPADYGVDPFAPAVNSRGDVASTDAGNLFVNGFLPRSAQIGGRPSFLLNTVNLDARYLSARSPVMVFTRLQFLPRWGGRGRGNQTSLLVEQAFGRVTPITGTEFFISAGKFDSVFGIEYLENQANFRTGITPSLFARYTTGTSLGIKAFYRIQVAPLWSAFSLNTAATNSGAFVEALQPPDVSLTGRPVISARLGYELNLRKVQVKLGGSGLFGPRNDQRDPDARQTMWGADARLYLYGVSLSGEWVDVDEDLGAVGKETGQGGYPIASPFAARGFWLQAAYGWRAGLGPLTALSVYTRYEERRASFEGFRPLRVARLTGGLRVDLWDALILKGEVLFNQELEGAPNVDNDVVTSSVVFSW